MKGAAVLLLCAIVIAQENLDGFFKNGCPRDTSIEKRLPHENCDQYYQCLHGLLLPRICESGLYYNHKLQKCDWSADVKCVKKHERTFKKPKQHEDLESDFPKRICTNSDVNGPLVAHENCNQFYKCSFGKPILLTCAINLLFNPLTQKCDWSQNVDCSDRETASQLDPVYYAIGKGNIIRDSRSNVPDSGYSDPSQAPALCAASDSNGVLVAHENCNQFYKCSGGRPIAMNCPVNLLYNPDKEYCDWPRSVECGDRLIPGTEDNNDTENAGNGESEESDTSSEADDSSNNLGNSDPSLAPAICAGTKSEGVLVAHENCNQFYKCSGGRPIALDCPAGLMYDPRKEHCDWAHSVECGDRNVPDSNDNEQDTDQNTNDQTSTPGGQIVGNNSDPSQALTICSGLESDGVLVAHENCNQFYKCDDGHPVALNCPGNLLYNPGKEYCDWPTDVECGDRSIPEPESEETSKESETGDSPNGSSNFHGDPSQAPAICAGYKSDGILIAHENCNQYYKCFEGKPVPLFCQPNLLYHPNKEYCDWPNNVNCGNRLIPVQENNSSSSSEEENNNGIAVATLCSTTADGDLVPHENCNQFYKCIGGQTYPMDCPKGLYYNSDLKVCDWPANVNCTNRTMDTQKLDQPRVTRILRKLRSLTEDIKRTINSELNRF